MTINGGRKRSRVPRAPLPPSSRPPTALELWYLDCFRRLRDYHGRSPSITEFAVFCNRSTFPAYTAMRSLERKGYVRRDAGAKGRFVVTKIGEDAGREVTS